MEATGVGLATGSGARRGGDGLWGGDTSGDTPVATGIFISMN